MGVIAVALPEVLGNGYETINLILGQQLGVGLLVVIMFAKAIATTASVSSGSPGGVFTPSLLLGAALAESSAISCCASARPAARARSRRTRWSGWRR